jgi:hypothetical protein
MMTNIIYCNEDSCWYLIYWSINPIVPVKGCCRLFIKYAIPLLCMIFSVIVWCMLKMCRFPWLCMTIIYVHTMVIISLKSHSSFLLFSLIFSTRYFSVYLHETFPHTASLPITMEQDAKSDIDRHLIVSKKKYYLHASWWFLGFYSTQNTFTAHSL